MHTCLHRIHGLVAVVLASAGCFSTATITGNGQNTMEDRQVAAFDAILVSDSFTAMITLAPDQPQSVRVSGDSNLVPLVRATLSGSELTLDLTSNTSIKPKLPLMVTISARALRALKAGNVAQVVASAVTGDDVVVESSDSASVQVSSITAAKSLSLATGNVGKLAATSITAHGPITLSADHSGQLEAMAITGDPSIKLTADNAATVALGGAASSLMAQLTRSASLRGQDLSARSVVVNASSVSSAQVCATSSLDVTLTTSSQVVYHCNPGTVTKSVDQTSTLTAE
jgi:hypothetical protein